MKILWFILLIGFVKIVLVYKIFHLVPLSELRRRARTNQKVQKIYKVAACQPALDALLWILGTAIGSALVISAAGRGWWQASLLGVFMAWLLVWSPEPHEDGWLWRIAGFASPTYFKIINWLRPALELLAYFLPVSRRLHIHSGLYEKEDLLELLSSQNHQVDNRIADQDLKMAQAALTFGDKKVGDVMTPRSKVRFVAVSESIGPMLMDELHKTGFSRFPVVKEIKKNAEPEIVGTLVLRDLIGREDEGPVSNLAQKGAHYINEADNLRQALDAFSKTRAHLLVVVNNFEEVAGIITLENVLEKIIGRPIEDDFYDYHRLKAVAGRSEDK